MAHNFNESLARSHKAEDLPIWQEVYKKAFPTMSAMINHRQDGDHQRAGIDRSIILDNSKQILIDEKVRFKNKNGRVYNDIALEYWSDEQRKVPGWVCKPLLCDYIAYAIEPLGICYLLPVIQLHVAWGKYGSDWIQQHHRISAFNESSGRKWTTVSVGVPPAKVFKAIGGCLRINFNSANQQQLK